MKRSAIREQIFKILFSADFYENDEREAQLALALDGMGSLSRRDRAYISQKVTDIYAHLAEIDAMVNAGAEKWKTTRMAKAELAIIRLAVYEMKYEEEIPVSVAINEAVELAKTYGAEKGPSFVNGILAKLT